MTVAVSIATEGVRLPVARTRIDALVRSVLRAERVSEALVSVAFVSSTTMARLNRQHLGHRGATDVISFAFNGAHGATRIGDIYISPDIARRNAREWGVGVREELARLVVHGVLHVLGYDHPAGDARTKSPMWRRQETLLGRFVG